VLLGGQGFSASLLVNAKLSPIASNMSSQAGYSRKDLGEEDSDSEESFQIFRSCEPDMRVTAATPKTRPVRRPVTSVGKRRRKGMNVPLFLKNSNLERGVGVGEEEMILCRFFPLLNHLFFFFF